ncbi:2-octaprenyl-6-methoxyphenol hydroxylase [Celeribacter marinus]|uniref:2-octaprenyl-3-methyl-6-methoxy-1, 4-benzoquinolhydroxylase n=2 Tax=Celeribacter marinus TaxID=1397108 RepID=A0A0N9ZG13_9RHOB|nr:FAD-dependent monooxygenase [Celeribacter marinus]ALI55871.1 2-octaprenyl-3-methyl-6-methoxy-1,4-benzoquinolhydroxylase [Celeribacter marinus]SFK89516.1 2-octaprenyl-6-methoxyphenol hydroxylase [Celeribacter marinus]
MDNPVSRVILTVMTQTSDLLIVGGGLNGPALALAAANAGLSVTIIDALPVSARLSSDFDGRGYALSLGSQKLLKAIKLWDAVAPNAQPILDVKVTDGKPGEAPAPFMLEFDHAEIDDGPVGFMIEDRYLRRVFLDALNDHPNITQVEGTVSGQDILPNGAQLTLSDGSTHVGKLIVGCDGRGSRTAARAGIKRTGWGYKQTALVCAVQHEKPHGGCAHQYFLPSGPLAILPLPNNQSSIVWTESDKVAHQIQALNDEDYLAVLKPRFGDFLGEISLAGGRFTYPLNITLANAFYAPRVALVGDAAHGMHPIAGQGLNAGLKDVGALTEVLIEAHRRGEDIGREDVLARYSQWRRFDIATMALMTDTFNKLFSNDNPMLRLVRDLGMGAVNALPNVRREAIREAAGVNGDLPKLMRGIAL